MKFKKNAKFRYYKYTHLGGQTKLIHCFTGNPHPHAIIDLLFNTYAHAHWIATPSSAKCKMAVFSESSEELEITSN